MYRLTIHNKHGIVSPKSMLPARDALKRWTAEEALGNKVTCRNRNGTAATRDQILEAAARA